MPKYADTVPERVGPSACGKTNIWRVQCPACGRRWTPKTTKLAIQPMKCEGCTASLRADYNAPAVRFIGVF